MFEILGKNYYIDLDAITEKCKTSPMEDGDEKQNSGIEINLFKYESIKMCLERVMSEYDEIDDQLFADKSLSVSFKLAFNTLTKNEIIIEEEND
jgi:hypothetical protein